MLPSHHGEVAVLDHIRIYGMSLPAPKDLCGSRDNVRGVPGFLGSTHRYVKG